ncbi:MAG TPA: hypothetical protein VK943_00425 [Arenibaculum sp.]|nr:hypothetical protein [Arenibaculum sp.]
MTVRIEAGVAWLEGSCPVEEAEALLEVLLAHPGIPVDWSGCRHLHSALVQVLMAARPTLRGMPEGPFLRRWIEPALTGA